MYSNLEKMWNRIFTKDHNNYLNEKVWYNMESEGILAGELSYDEIYGKALLEDVIKFEDEYGKGMTVGDLINLIGEISIKYGEGQIVKKPSPTAYNFGWPEARASMRLALDPEFREPIFKLEVSKPIVYNRF